MRVFPPPGPGPDSLLGWHRAGAEGVRARTIIGAAQVAGRFEEIAGMPPAEADLRLRSLPGIGAWTSAETRQRACGDPDAVSVGDDHLPGAVGWALAGRPADNAGMLQLLAPYAGHRHRAARLVELRAAGPPRAAPGCPPATTGRSERLATAPGGRQRLLGRAGQAAQGKGVRSGSTQLVLAAGRPGPAPSSAGPAGACPAARGCGRRRNRSQCQGRGAATW